MMVKKLIVENFRNYKQSEWSFGTGLNVFYGQNGQGKTNILEALHFVSLGSSHRTSQEDDLFYNIEQYLSVRVIVENLIGSLTITVKKNSRRTRKEIRINQDRIKPRELIGQLRLVLFSPEDLRLLKGEPAERRRFIDVQAAQMDRHYCFALAYYNKLLQQRNRLLILLKDGKAKEQELDIWDGQLAKEAAFIVEFRLRLVAKLSRLAAEVYQRLAGTAEEINSNYKRRENAGENLLTESTAIKTVWYEEQLHTRRQLDIERGITGIGPHRDDLFFTLNNQPAKNFASQGQQRSFILSLKMAQMQLFYTENGEYPIVLLDDVLSELDVQRRTKLLSFLDGRAQTFITLTERPEVALPTPAKFYYIQAGQAVEE